jgi:uncharacterized protein
MARHFRKLLAVSGIGGDADSATALLGELSDADAEAVAVVGDLAGPSTETQVYRAIFRAFGESDLPAFWVPGPRDAPLRHYLRESYNMEIVYPTLHGVHGTAALGPDQVLFAGMGGEILDDPGALRDEEKAIRYPGWEAEYRLKLLREFDEHQKVLLFATPPAHKGLHAAGSEVVAELIKTHRPRVAIVGGDQPILEVLGRTLVVSPGRLDRGECALVDIGEPSAELRTFAGLHATV